MDTSHQIAELREVFQSVCLTLDDLIHNRIKPADLKIAKLEEEVVLLREDIKILHDRLKSVTEQKEDKSAEDENHTKVEGKIDELEVQVKQLEVNVKKDLLFPLELSVLSSKVSISASNISNLDTTCQKLREKMDKGSGILEEIKVQGKGIMEKSVTFQDRLTKIEAKGQKIDCTYCNRKLKSQHGLWRHINEKHLQISQPSSICQICGAKYQNRDDLWKHTIKVHIDCIQEFSRQPSAPADQSNVKSYSSVLWPRLL